MEWSEYLKPLTQGAWITIQLTVYSTILGAICAFAFGIGKLSTNWAIKGFSIVYIEIFRGTSLLVQLFWLYFALPIAGDMIGINLRLPPVVAGVMALGLNIGAYGAEVVRGAIQSVRYSQYEAAKALNFSPRQALWRIALPQAIPEMMPAFGNLAVQNLKDTALAYAFGGRRRGSGLFFPHHARRRHPSDHQLRQSRPGDRPRRGPERQTVGGY